MKRLINVFLIVVSVFLLLSCQDNNPTNPAQNQNDQTMIPDSKQTDNRFSPFAKVVSHFTGTSNFVAPLEPGTERVLPNGKTLVLEQKAEWYDEASDARVTGQTIWVINKLLNKDGTGRVWGSAVLNVDDGGKWDMIWWGTLTSEGIVAKAVGSGVEGAVKGLTAKWTYTMDFAQGFFYTSKGIIIER